MQLPRQPEPNKPVTADWGRAVVDCLRRLRPHSGPGVLVNQTPEGTTYSAKPVRGAAGEEAPERLAVPCRTTGVGSMIDGWEVEVYANGTMNPYTHVDRLYILEAHAAAEITSNMWFLGRTSVAKYMGGTQ